MKLIFQRVYDNKGGMCGKYLLTFYPGIEPFSKAFTYALAVVDDFGNLHMVTDWN